MQITTKTSTGLTTTLTCNKGDYNISVIVDTKNGKLIGNGIWSKVNNNEGILLRNAKLGKKIMSACVVIPRSDYDKLEIILNETETARKKKWEDADKLETEKNNIELKKMEIIKLKLIAKLQKDHIMVDCKYNKINDYDLFEYYVDGVKIDYDDVNIIGDATATRPGAFSPFKIIRIATISKTKLSEIKALRIKEKNAKILKVKKADEKRQLIFKKSKDTNTKQLITSYTCDCTDPKEDCSTDIVYEYAMPDGTIDTVRNHTW